METFFGKVRVLGLPFSLVLELRFVDVLELGVVVQFIEELGTLLCGSVLGDQVVLRGEGCGCLAVSRALEILFGARDPQRMA